MPESQTFPSITKPEQKAKGLGHSDFESLEPSRHPTDERMRPHNTHSSQSKQTSNNIYDQSEVVQHRRREDIIRLEEQAAIII